MTKNPNQEEDFWRNQTSYFRTIAEDVFDTKSTYMEDKINKSDKINRIFDVSAIIIAAIVAFYTYRVSLSTDSLQNDSINQLKNTGISIDQTNKALEIAGDSLSVTKNANVSALDNFHLQQRAYVVFEASQGSGLESLAINLKNAGLTPALNVVHNRRIMLGNYDNIMAIIRNSDAKNFNPQNKQEISIGPGSISTPQSIVVVDYKYSIEKPDINEIKLFMDGKHVAFVWGIVRYKDIFNISHITRYCEYFEKGNFEIVNYCDTHNDLD